jgi:D-lactate dehydrogenase (cytochrome)
MNGEYLEIQRGVYLAEGDRECLVHSSDGSTIRLNIPDYPLPNSKNAAGYFSSPNMDLIDLFIGSEGTLGIITQVEVALFKQNEKLSMVQFLDSDEQAIKLTQNLRTNSFYELDFLEFYSANALKLLREKTAH